MKTCDICEKPKADVGQHDYLGSGEAQAGSQPSANPFLGQLKTCATCHQDLEDPSRPNHVPASRKKDELLRLKKK